MTKKLEPPPKLLNINSPWKKNENPIWLASTLCLSRNIEKFNFPSKLSSDKRNQIISLVSKEIVGFESVVDPVLFRSEEMSPFEKEYLYEHFLTTRSFQEAHHGEGFVVDKSGQFLTAINVQDHLLFLMTDISGELERTLNYLNKIESDIGKNIHYSFSSKFGFLTANINDVGSGFSIYTYLQVPALIHTRSIEEFLIKNSDDSISVTGLQGRPNEIIGDLIVVHNNYTLGMTEETILSHVRTYTIKLLVREKGLRSEIKKNGDPKMKDKVSRAFGLLKHSYQIDAIEALDAISLVKLGVDIEWIKGLSVATLNLLMFDIRRVHLQFQFEEEFPKEELTHKRSEFIHEALKSAELLI